MLHVQLNSGAVQHNTNSSAGELMATGVKIHAVDYKRLDIPEPRTTWHCCGRKGSWYVENLRPLNAVPDKGTSGRLGVLSVGRGCDGDRRSHHPHISFPHGNGVAHFGLRALGRALVLEEDTSSMGRDKKRWSRYLTQRNQSPRNLSTLSKRSTITTPSGSPFPKTALFSAAWGSLL